MSDLIIWENPVPAELKDPVLVVALDGWIEAGFAAQTAMGTLKGQIRTQRLLRFDTDELLDQRARRPTMRLVNGVNTELKWPRLQLRHGRDAAGQDLLVLTGPEPDMRWNKFVSSLMDVVEKLDVRMCVGLGSFPAAATHTRPVSIGSTATSQELAEEVGYLEGTMEIPAGVQAAIERGFSDAGRPAIGLWARVPHYAGAMPFPAAAAALLDTLARITGLVIDTMEIRTAGISANAQIDQLVRNNDEHVEMVRRLEEQVDNEAQMRPGRFGMAGTSDLGDLPSGDELAAELEKFLREQ
jgi:proteasome assembly chaperone (PAC2) family protein